MQGDRRQHTGFSIIELIVVIGVVMVLIGILLPVLGGARGTAQQTKLASQVRQLATMVSMYCDSNDGIYPVADERFWFLPYTGVNGNPPYEEGRWWAYPLIDTGFFTLDQARDPEYLDASNQSISIAMCYDHKKMNPDHIEPYSERYTSAVHQSSASYPSGLGMLSVSVVQSKPELRYWCCTPIDPSGPVAFADTSVDMIAWHEFPDPEHAPILGIGRPAVSTWNGIHGHDR